MVKTCKRLSCYGLQQRRPWNNTLVLGDSVDAESYDEEQARNPYADFSGVDRTDQNNVLYVEHYVFYDLDGDGIDERIRVCTVGKWDEHC